MTAETIARPYVDNVLMVHNPKCASPDIALERIDLALAFGKASGITVNVVESGRTPEETDLILLENITPTTVTELLGGDGLKHHAASRLVKLGLENCVSFFGAGGANDLADQTHRGDYHDNNAHSIVGSAAVKHRPLSIEASHPTIEEGDPRQHIQALGYFSIGFTADMSARFNEPDFRNKVEGKSRNIRLAHQGLLIATAIPSYDKPFTVHSERGEQKLNDLVYPNGARMAKIVHFTGLHLLKPGFGRQETETINFRQVGGGVGKALTGMTTKFDPTHVETFAITTRDEDDFLVQADGETYPYPSDTTFIVKLSDQSIPIVTTHPNYWTGVDLSRV